MVINQHTLFTWDRTREWSFCNSESMMLLFWISFGCDQRSPRHPPPPGVHHCTLEREGMPSQGPTTAQRTSELILQQNVEPYLPKTKSFPASSVHFSLFFIWVNLFSQRWCLWSYNKSNVVMMILAAEWQTSTHLRIIAITKERQNFETPQENTPAALSYVRNKGSFKNTPGKPEVIHHCGFLEDKHKYTCKGQKLPDKQPIVLFWVTECKAPAEILGVPQAWLFLPTNTLVNRKIMHLLGIRKKSKLAYSCKYFSAKFQCGSMGLHDMHKRTMVCIPMKRTEKEGESTQSVETHKFSLIPLPVWNTMTFPDVEFARVQEASLW